MYGLLGHNGAGKSTTVEILEGHRQATSGSVSVLGTPAGEGSRELRDRIGIVLQSSGVEPQLTVAEALRFYGSPYRTRRSIDDVLEMVDLAGKRDARIGTLSGGQRRRLDLGLGIIGRPEVLFLDEPTTGFDPVARRQSWQLVQRLCEGGTTVLLTTHYLDEAEHLADRVGVLVARQARRRGHAGRTDGGRARGHDLVRAARRRRRRPARGAGPRHRRGTAGDDRHRGADRSARRDHRRRRRPWCGAGGVERAPTLARRGVPQDRGGVRRDATAGRRRRSLVLEQTRYQVLTMLRSPVGMFFTIGLPTIMLVLFNALFGGDTIDTPAGEWSVRQFYTGGLAAFTAVSATYTNLVNVVPIRRDEGDLEALALDARAARGVPGRVGARRAR